MKTIIAGSRSITDYRIVEKAVAESGIEITEVVSGCARGVDSLGEKWGAIHGKSIKLFFAKWEQEGKSAGYKRNERMAEYANALIAVWDGKSKGTQHMINIARQRGLKIYVKIAP